MYSLSKKIKIVAFMLIVFCVAVSAIPVWAKDKKDVIRVAFFQLDGFNETDENGKHSGYGYDYLRELAKYTGWKYEFVSSIEVKDYRGNPTGTIMPLTYSAALQMVKDGELDIVGMVEKTDETRRFFEFPQLDVCNQYGVLSILEPNEEIDINDTKTLDGIKVGVIKGVAKNMDLLEYFKENNIIKYSIVSYEDQEKLSNALRSKIPAIDAMYTTSLRSMDSEKIILRWKPKPYYFVTGKGNADIIESIDYAQEMLEINTPTFKEDLNLKYYSVSPGDAVVFTKEENEYIKRHPNVTVAVDPSWIPIEYFDFKTKEYKGIVADVLAEVEKRTGITFNYVVANNYADAINLVKNGEAQVISSIADDYNIVDQLDLQVTLPYMDINTSAITQEDIRNLYDEKNIVAMVNGYLANGSLQDSMPNNSFVYYNTSEECIAAVKKGKVDVAFVATYCAEYLTGKPKYNSLKVVGMSDMEWRVGFGLNGKENKLLYHIINKSVARISKQQVNEIVLKNVLSATDDENWIYLFYRHPLAISIICMFVVLIIVFGKLKLDRTEREAKKQRLRDEERFRIAISKTNICVWDLDIVRREIIKTESSMKIYGGPMVVENAPESLIRSGIYHSDDIEIIRNAHERVYAGETDVKFTYRVKNVMVESEHLGEYRWEKTIYTTIYDGKGQPLRAIGVSENVTKRMLDLEKKKKAEQFRTATVEGALVFLEINLNNDEVSISDKVFKRCQNTDKKFTIHQAVEKLGIQYVHSEDYAKVIKFFDVPRLRKKYQRGITESYGEFRIIDETDQYLWSAFVINLVKDEDTGHIIGYFTAKNVDERKRYELSLKNKAEQDLLTGMYNRDTFEQMTKRALSDRRNAAFVSAFMIIDIDDFKSINDTMGHDCGDEAIRLVANALRLVFRANDILARLGGDEFVVFMNRAATKEDVERKAEKVCEVIRHIESKKYEDLKITASVGVAITTEQVKTFDILYKKADEALYVCKNNGKNGFWVYNS